MVTPQIAIATIVNYTIRKLASAGESRSAHAQVFPTKNGGKMTRPRAADDFAVIRARMVELRRERAQGSVEQETRPPGPRPSHVATSVLEKGRYPRLSRAIRQKLFG
jgi:hypothetical protein